MRPTVLIFWMRWMMTRNDAVTIQWTPQRGPPRRVLFHPQEDGSYRRETQEWNGCRWRIEGSEIVEDVSVEDGAEVMA